MERSAKGQSKQALSTKETKERFKDWAKDDVTHKE